VVKVHEPVEGKPDNATLPEETKHVGCDTVPKIGVDGVVG
jgi:hypothetical protein